MAPRYADYSKTRSPICVCMVPCVLWCAIQKCIRIEIPFTRSNCIGMSPQCAHQQQHQTTLVFASSHPHPLLSVELRPKCDRDARICVRAVGVCAVYETRTQQIGFRPSLSGIQHTQQQRDNEARNRRRRTFQPFLHVCVLQFHKTQQQSTRSVPDSGHEVCFTTMLCATDRRSAMRVGSPTIIS